MFTNTQEPPVNNLSPGFLQNTYEHHKKSSTFPYVACSLCLKRLKRANFSIDHLCLAWLMSAPGLERWCMMGGPTWSPSPDGVTLSHDDDGRWGASETRHYYLSCKAMSAKLNFKFVCRSFLPSFMWCLELLLKTFERGLISINSWNASFVKKISKNSKNGVRCSVLISSFCESCVYCKCVILIDN